MKGRVFVLTQDLLPATAEVTVTAEDPEKNKMARWQLVSTAGFVEFEMPISDQPVLGEWTLTVEATDTDTDNIAATSETFEIAEYVLPRFAVELTAPDVVSMEDAGVDGVVGQIEGVFTHGNSVVGTAVLELYAEKCRGWYCRRNRRALDAKRPPHILAANSKRIADEDLAAAGGDGGGAARRSSPSRWGYFGYDEDDAADDPIARTTVQLEGGAAPFSFSVRSDSARGSAACQVGSWESSCFTDRMSFGRPLTVKATVMESATGVEVDAEAEIATSEHDIDFTFEFDRRTYVPGLPLTMRLSVHRIDGSPVAALPGSSKAFTPSIRVGWNNYVCGNPQKYAYGDEACSSTYSCALVAGSCSVQLDVPPTADFIEASVVNAEGNGNSGRVSHAMYSPSNTHLRAEADQSTGGGTLSVSLKSVTNRAAFAVEISNLQANIEREKSYLANRWNNNEWSQQQIESFEASLEAVRAAKETASARYAAIMYSVVGGGTLLASGKVPAADFAAEGRACSDDECSASFTVENLPAELGNTPKLVVYFVAESGEIVSDSVELESSSSLKHSVSVAFDTSGAESVLPGATVDVKVAVGGSGGGDNTSTSLVGLIAVDKSVYLLRNRQALAQSDFLDAKDEASKLGYGKLSLTSEDHFDRAGIALITDAETHFADLGSKYMSYPWGYGDGYGGGYGDVGIFGGGGGGMPMMEMDMAMAADGGANFAGTSRGATNEEDIGGDDDGGVQAKDGGGGAATAPRAYFPESWNELWTTMIIPDGTEQTVTVEAPDTITSWILGGYAVSSAHGVAVSDTNDLVVFQPFFIEMKLPYSVVRGESFELVVAVYNYEDEASAVTVALSDGGNAFTVAGGASSSLTARCAAVSKTSPCAVTFDVTPTALGQIMFEVTGSSAAKRDVVQRNLLVKAEGIERSYLSSAFMEPTAGQDDSATLSTRTGADGVVEGSVRLMFSATANLMASSIEGLSHLVRMPTGCGEQNMVTFAPIISVRKYFDATSTLSAEMAKKTAEYMKVGYQRELTYQRSDKGFSAFGESDDESSLWLSAFVLRSFAQSAQALGDAADGYYIDPAVVAGIAEFIVGLQKTNGEFEPSGLVLHTDMKGGIASNGASSLAAYVALSLIEARDLITDAAVKQRVQAAIAKTVAYLQQVNIASIETPYAAALITFALVKAGVSTAADVDAMIATVESLWTTSAAAVADEDEPYNPWSYCYSTPSADVETVAYAVLVMTEVGRLDDAYAASKWLVEKRGGHGGWQSTQDTVVGLEALSAYSAAVYAAQDDITVTISAGEGFSESIVLNQDNYDMIQTVAIPASAAPSEVSVVAQGNGKCIVSVEVDWNEPTPTAISPPIEIQTLLVPIENGGIRCEICATIAADAVAGRRRQRRNADGSAATGMALVQVQPFSGWAPASMAETRRGNPSAKRVDNDGREGITFYLDGIGEATTCVQLELSQDFPVNGLKPVQVSASDYYEPGVRNDVLLSFDNQAEPDETILVNMESNNNNNNNGGDGDGVSPSAAMTGASSAMVTAITVGAAIWLQLL